MKKFLLPLILVLLGVGGGGAAGLFLKPDPVEQTGDGEHDCVVPETAVSAEVPDEGNTLEYVKLSNQFIVPVLKSGRVTALVVMSLSIEVEAGYEDAIYEREPKLRDVFNDVMYLHANTGGFDGVFTDTLKMQSLRKGLLEAAKGIVGSPVTGVLVMDIVRQET